MAKQRYFPTREGDRILWLKNYEMKFPAHVATLGMGGELAATLADLAYAIYILETWHPALQADLEEATVYKRFVLTAPSPGEPVTPLPSPTGFAPPPAVTPGIYTRLFDQVARVKLQPGYTEAIGEDLGIIGPDEIPKDATDVTTVKIQVLDGSPNQVVELKFTKDGHEGVHIESRVNGGAWEPLTVTTQSPYLDERPLAVPATPETREYRFRYWDKGDPNGNYTPVVKVTVGA